MNHQGVAFQYDGQFTWTRKKMVTLYVTQLVFFHFGSVKEVLRSTHSEFIALNMIFIWPMWIVFFFIFGHRIVDQAIIHCTTSCEHLFVSPHVQNCDSFIISCVIHRFLMCQDSQEDLQASICNAYHFINSLLCGFHATQRILRLLLQHMLENGSWKSAGHEFQSRF